MVLNLLYSSAYFDIHLAVPDVFREDAGNRRMSPRRSAREIKCLLLWKLCRSHGWGAPVDREALVNRALESTDQGRGKQLVDELLEEPYIGHDPRSGYYIVNDPDGQARAAYRLLETCEYGPQFRIEATLSRFEQAGGFDAYPRMEAHEEPKPW